MGNATARPEPYPSRWGSDDGGMGGIDWSQLPPELLAQIAALIVAQAGR